MRDPERDFIKKGVFIMAEKKGLVAEFKEFMMRGNVMDMAVGVIIGGAFGAIISSLVADVITPIIGLIFGQPDFSAITIGGSRFNCHSHSAGKECFPIKDAYKCPQGVFLLLLMLLGIDGVTEPLPVR